MANEYDLMLEHPVEHWYEFTHCCMQTAWVEKAAEWMRQFNKPVVYDECCYEGNLPQNWGNISAFELVHRFRSVCTVGACCTHGHMSNYTRERI